MIFVPALPQVCWYETYQKFTVDTSLKASIKATVNLIDGAWQVLIIDATNSGLNSPWQTDIDTVDGLACLSPTNYVGNLALCALQLHGLTAAWAVQVVLQPQ